MTDKMTVSFNCKRCGTKLTWADDAIDSTLVSCAKCGEKFGTYADLRHTAMEAAKGKVRDMVRDAFKNIS